MFGGGVEGFPAFHGFGDAAPEEAVAAVEDDADLVFDVVLPFLPTDILAHRGEV